MTYGNNIGHNEWHDWAKFVLAELERLANIEINRDEQISTLHTRVTRLEEQLKTQIKALAWIAGVAAMSLAGLIVGLINILLK